MSWLAVTSAGAACLLSGDSVRAIAPRPEAFVAAVALTLKPPYSRPLPTPLGPIPALAPNCARAKWSVGVGALAVDLDPLAL